MPDTPDQIAGLTDAIASGPSSASVADRSASAQKIPDMIELEKYRRNTSAATFTPGLGQGIGVRFFKLVPPGAVL